MGLHHHSGSIGAKETGHPRRGSGVINDDPGQIRAHVIPQNPVNEILIAIQQHRRNRRVGSLLNAFPLAKQGLEVIDQKVFADPVGLRSDQQSRAGRLDQHPKRPQAIALRLRSDPA